jgi:lipopolysaccharide biosynthesis protein
MKSDFKTLASHLQSRLDIISNSTLRENDPTEQLRKLQEVSEAIVAWHQQNRGNIPAHLNHFLQQQSLSKALDYLKSEGLV